MPESPLPPALLPPWPKLHTCSMSASDQLPLAVGPDLWSRALEMRGPRGTLLDRTSLQIDQPATGVRTNTRANIDAI
jgi:hypothetical protein